MILRTKYRDKSQKRCQTFFLDMAPFSFSKLRLLTIAKTIIFSLLKSVSLNLFQVSRLKFNSLGQSCDFSANDNPHGVFKLQPGAQTIQVEGNNRKLQFTVEREMGTFGAVDVQYQVRHSAWYPTEMQGSVTVPDGERQARLI